MATKDDLHQLVDQFNEDADAEDEPLRDEELARVEAGEAELRRGESVSLEGLKRRLVDELVKGRASKLLEHANAAATAASHTGASLARA